MNRMKKYLTFWFMEPLIKNQIFFAFIRKKTKVPSVNVQVPEEPVKRNNKRLRNVLKKIQNLKPC